MTDETLSKNLSIKSWAEDDRPREKLLLKGRHNLSDAELLAILIATGTREDSAVDLAKKLLQLTNNQLSELGQMNVKDLRQIKGIGEAKAITILAALELGRRRKDSSFQQRPQITSSKISFDLLLPLVSDLPYEAFWIVLLNRNHRVLATKRISEGGISGTVVDPKIVFNLALTQLASAIILCHNHPSGNLSPSEADIQLTRKLKDAGKFLDILILDHLIIAENRYFSFSDEGLI